MHYPDIPVMNMTNYPLCATSGLIYVSFLIESDSLQASRVALCTSGTVSVEMQLARLPCVVAYRAHFLTEWFIRWRAKIPYISIPNILLDSAIIPEALLQECTPEKLASLLMYAWTILFSFQF